MHRLNLLFTLSSLSVLLVTIERFSFTTKILLQPYDFFRLHEIIQMTVLILITIVIPFFLLYVISDRFQFFAKKQFFWLPLLFVIGIYFYATGNGVHETASFTLNQYCDIKALTGNLCHGLFVNDYYTGNIFFFIGGILMVLAVVLTEKLHPNKTYHKKDVAVTIINAVIYSLAIFAYAAFDVVLVGLVYSILVMIIADVLLLSTRKKYLQHPVILYHAVAYTLGTAVALLIRFH